MRRTLAAGLLAMCVAGATPCAADPSEVPPYKTVRMLQALQDRIATGDTLAQAAHGKAVQRAGRAFAAMKPDTWSDPRNARALVSYLFSGGYAAAVEQAIPVAAVAKGTGPLYEGALAYGRGDDERARALLLPIDAKALPAGLAGHLALVQATLSEAGDKAKATALLDLARLLEPGTLVEEAALRKEMALTGESGDLDKLLLLARRYWNAFPRSLYAEDCRQLLGRLAIRAAETNSDAGNSRLERLAAAIAKDERRRLYLGIARREAIAGHLVSAPFAAAEGGRLSAKGDRDEARAKLYFGASALVGERYDKALAALGGIPVEQLDDKDRTLRLSALDMAASIREAATKSGEAAPPAAGATLSRAEDALRGADAVLASVSK